MSRLGSPNKDKKVVRDLAAAHGVDVIEMRILLLKDCMKSVQSELGRPRSRRSKVFFQAEEMANKHLTELTPYLHGKLSNITVADETPRITVIRGPEAISDTQAWLANYGPGRDVAVNDRPAVPFVRNLRESLDTAEALGINDASAIVNEAQKRTTETNSEDVITSWDRKFLKGYD
jgi:hypothetical protein